MNRKTQPGGSINATKEARYFFWAATIIPLDLYLVRPPLSIELLVAVLTFVIAHLWVAHKLHPSPHIQVWISLFAAASLFQSSCLLATVLYK